MSGTASKSRRLQASKQGGQVPADCVSSAGTVKTGGVT